MVLASYSSCWYTAPDISPTNCGRSWWPSIYAGAQGSSNPSISWIRNGKLGSVNESPGAGTR